MGTIRVLVVDDSAFSRELISSLLEEDGSVEVVGSAENGMQAVMLNEKLRPDLITMDIAMPVMDGYEAIETIMAHTPVPILVLTSLYDAEAAFKAVGMGALEVMDKDCISAAGSAELITKVNYLSKVKVIRHLYSIGRRAQSQEVQPVTKAKHLDHPVIAVAASTGGPKAVASLLGALPPGFPASLLIAQHIGGEFIPGLASWLSKVTSLDVRIASEGDVILPGFVYLAPAGKHLLVGRNLTASLENQSSRDIYAPSCDKLFLSLAEHCTDRAVGIVLTGMGRDGALGIASVKQAGGVTIAQDEETSVVFGMPRAAIETKRVDCVMALQDIAPSLIRFVQTGELCRRH